MRCEIESIIRKAGELMLSFENPEVKLKAGHANFVTEADVAVQAYLMEALARQYPGARFYAEEKDDNCLTDALTFFIDPIDGTTNYMRGRGCSVISVGALAEGKPLFGAILDPYRQELFHASAGAGAWCGDTRLHVSDIPAEHALIYMGTAVTRSEFVEPTMRSAGLVLRRFGDLRRLGSAARELCDIACGLAEGSFEWQLQPWDYCAGALLVQEAGGRCGNILGGGVTHDGGIPFMAATPACYDVLQETLQQACKN